MATASNNQISVSALSFDIARSGGGAEAQILPPHNFKANGIIPAKVDAFMMNAQIAQNLIQKINLKQNDTLIDYDHQSLLSQKNGQKVIAAGWFDTLEYRSDGLYATNISWTATAKNHLEKKEYRYISAVFTYNAATGEILEIISIALTNTPAVDGMAEALAGLSIDQIKQLGVTDMQNPDTAALSTQIAALSQQLTEAKNQVSTLETEKAALSQNLTAAEKRADDLEAKQKKAAEAAEKKQHGELLQTALSDGRLTPKQKPWAEKQSFAALSEFLESATPVLDGERQSERENGAKDKHGLDETELAMCSQMQIPPEEFAKTKTAQAA